MTTIDYPEAGPGPDLRANAFVGAWERIEAAQKLKVDPKNHRLVDPLPEIYWATIAEAAVLAQLATADEDPGRDAGRHLLDRKERLAEARTHFADAISRRKPNPTGSTEAGRGVPSFDNGPADPPFAEGHWVRVKRGDWAGRCGTVTAVYRTNHPPVVDVALDLVSLGDQPVTITVLPADLELIGKNL